MHLRRLDMGRLVHTAYACRRCTKDMRLCAVQMCAPHDATRKSMSTCTRTAVHTGDTDSLHTTVRAPTVHVPSVHQPPYLFIHAPLSSFQHAKRMGTCACQLCCCPACPHHVRRVLSALLMPWCPHYRWCTNGTSTVGAPTHLPIVHRRPCPYLSCTCPYLSCTCLSTTN